LCEGSKNLMLEIAKELLPPNTPMAQGPEFWVLKRFSDVPKTIK